MKAGTVFVSALLLAAMPAWSQRITASLGGLVADPSGAAVPGAHVRIINTGTSVAFEQVTGSEGRYLAPSLAPGPYDVVIEAAGFKKTERKGIVLNVDQSAELNFTLEVGAPSESVEVTGEAPLLDTESGALGQVINNRSIVNLPLNQRNPFSLILLSPGVTGSVGTSFTGLQFNVNGGRSGSTDVLLDGVPSSPPTDSFNTLAIFPSVDAVQEFKVQTSSFSAEFGISGSGIINVVYKSGSNEFHGSAYDFLRNSVLDANNFFANLRGQPLASFKRNQFGFSLGGPVLVPKVFNGRNRTFFFVSYEGLRQRSASDTTTTVPTAGERSGDFSQVRTTSGSAITIFDPLTTALSNGVYTRQAFAGNLIPRTRFDRVAANAIRYWPNPNSSGVNGTQVNNFFASGAARYDIDQYDIKGDEVISARQRISIRGSKRTPASTPARIFPADIAIAQNGGINTQDGTGAALNYTFSVTPRYLIEFRYGLSRIVYHVSTFGDGFDPTTLGLPAYLKTDVNFTTFPGLNPAGYLGIGQASQLAVGDLAMMSHSWALANTKVFSRHNLKFGAEARLLINDTNQQGRGVGDYSFGTNFTQGPNALSASSTAGDGFASYLLGLGSGTLTHNFKIINTKSEYWAGYIQDDWKMSSKLTVNLGLRYDLFLPRIERYNRQNYIDLTAVNPLAGPSGIASLKGGLVFTGVQGTPRTQTDTNYDNLAPRVGFAYQLANRLVLRGAAGIFYTNQPTEAAATVGATGFRTDSPYLGTLDGVTPYNYLSDPFPGDVFLPVSGSSLGLLTSVGQSISAPFRTSHSSYMENYNFGAQYQLPSNWLIDVSYSGSHGLNLIWSPSYNQLPVSTLALGSRLLQNVPNPFFGLISSGPLSTQQVQQRYLMAPYPEFTGVAWGYQPGATSRYNSIQIRVEKRFTQSFTLLAAFTGSKLMDDGSSNNTSNFNGSGTSQDANNRHDDWSLSTADVSSRFVFSGVYSLPFGRGRRFGGGLNKWADLVAGGWQANAIVTFQTGVPLALSASNVANIFNPGERPNNNGKSALLSGSVQDRLNRYFDTSVFSQPATYTLGNVSRTLPDVRTPGLRNFDISLFKDFKLREPLVLEFRAESFNALNTPQFGGPNTSVTSTAFGVISSQANAPRQNQMALKIRF